MEGSRARRPRSEGGRQHSLDVIENDAAQSGRLHEFLVGPTELIDTETSDEHLHPSSGTDPCSGRSELGFMSMNYKRRHSFGK